MRLLRTLLIGTVALAAPAQVGAADLKLCEDAAAKLRADQAFTVSGSKFMPLKALSRTGLVEIATSAETDTPDEKSADAYAAAFASKYRADANLVAAVKDLVVDGYGELWSLQGSDVHALSVTGGSAACSQFLFFEKSRLLPDPPAFMQGGLSEDTSGPITECYHSSGNLARVGRQIVFAATDIGFENDGAGLRIVPLEAGRWGPGCRIATEFEIRYSVTKSHLAPDSPLDGGRVAKLALALARAKDEANDAKRAFSYGPSLAGHGALIAAVKSVLDGKIPSEAGLFADDDARAEFDFVNAVDDAGTIVDGQDYLVRIAHPAVGWRDEPGYVMTLYALKDGKLVGAASATVDAERGKVKSIDVSELK